MVVEPVEIVAAGSEPWFSDATVMKTVAVAKKFVAAFAVGEGMKKNLAYPSMSEYFSATAAAERV